MNPTLVGVRKMSPQLHPTSCLSSAASADFLGRSRMPYLTRAVKEQFLPQTGYPANVEDHRCHAALPDGPWQSVTHAMPSLQQFQENTPCRIPMQVRK